MRTTKAYLAGLGMTGILIASTLLLLMLGTGFAAFDSLPDLGGGRDLERVVLHDGEHPRDAAERQRAEITNLTARRPGRRGGLVSRGEEQTGAPREERGGAGLGRRGRTEKAGERLGGGAEADNGGGEGGGGEGGGGEGGPGGGSPPGSPGRGGPGSGGGNPPGGGTPTTPPTSGGDKPGGGTPNPPGGGLPGGGLPTPPGSGLPGGLPNIPGVELPGGDLPNLPRGGLPR
jgi:hypothetical protein